jgi:hypothetical protein
MRESVDEGGDSITLQSRCKPGYGLGRLFFMEEVTDVTWTVMVPGLQFCDYNLTAQLQA